MYYEGSVVHESLVDPGLSCAMYGGEAARICFLARSCLLALGRWQLKHGVQGILANQPALADLDSGNFTLLDFPRDSLARHAEDGRRLFRGEQLLCAHDSYHLPSIEDNKRQYNHYKTTVQPKNVINR